MKKGIFFLNLIGALLIFIVPVYSAYDFEIPDVRSSALGGADVANVDDIHSLFVNPAGLPEIPGFGAYFTFAPVNMQFSKPYIKGTDDFVLLTTMAGGAAIPLRFSGLNFGVVSLGYEGFIFPKLYNENNFQLTYAYNILHQLSIGASLKVLYMSITESSSSKEWAITPTFDIGVKGVPIPSLSIAAYFENVIPSKIGKTDNRLKPFLNIGAAYSPVPNLTVMLSISKSGFADITGIRVRSGIEFTINKFFGIRSGVMTNPAVFSAGLFAKLKMVNIDYSFSMNLKTGMSHMISLAVQFGERKGSIFVPVGKKPRKEITPIPGEELTAEEKHENEINKRKEQREKKQKYAGKLNINTASVAELSVVPGLGSKTAAKIVEYRDQHGYFKSIRDLTRVEKVGPNTVKKWMNFIYCEMPGKEEKPQSENQKEGPESAFDLNNSDIDGYISIGIPKEIAEKIIEYRNKNGDFKSMDDFDNIEGMTSELKMIILRATAGN